MERIVIFGGTGTTGQCAVSHALNKGIKVRILVRDENTVPDSFKDKLEIVKGDVLNITDVQNAIKGVDAVCIALGTRNCLEPTTALSTGTKNIVAAMKENNLTKVSCCLSAFLFYEPEKVPKIFTDLNADHQRQFDVIKSSGLEWIAILPPHIADEPSGEFQVLHDKSPGRSISKWDLGKFLIDCLDQKEHCCKVCGLATIKPQA